MSKKIVIDPLTRIEGHLGIEVEVYRGKVIYSRCMGNMFRGFEVILQGRDPRDALLITQRICGVCSASHSNASARCLDDAFGVTLPENARIIRNLVVGANYLHSHLLHFYHLAVLDFVAGPDTPPFVPRYKGDYRLPEKVNAACVKHYFEALKVRMLAHEMRALWAGRAPHHVGFIAGGVTGPPSLDKITGYLYRLKQVASFIDNVYLPDVYAVADAYEEYTGIGKGYGNLLSYGVFDLDGGKKLFKPGTVLDGQSRGFKPEKISEEVFFSRYKDESSGRHPQYGMTEPYPAKDVSYSWVKAPRYEGIPYETGPLARMWVNGDYRKGISVIDRHLSRALEAKKIAEALGRWVKELQLGKPVYDTGTTVPRSAKGQGLTEAPRGALGHWIQIEAGKTANYQIITPTCWDISPRDDKGNPGPIEQALIGTRVADEENPIEIARIIRSYDPCLACAVHMLRPKGAFKRFRIT